MAVDPETFQISQQLDKGLEIAEVSSHRAVDIDAILDQAIHKDGEEEYHSADESEDESKISKKPTHISQKRQAQNSIFEAHLTRKARSITKETLRDEAKQSRDEDLSIASILAKQQIPTIKDPREYQIELFERAKSENIIAVLDTGSGKTLIGVLLLKHILDKELEDRAIGLPPRISYFLVNLCAPKP
jgi:endoribonuclease Dicer